MDKIIISLAVDGREKYSEIVKGLEKSLVLWDGDVIIYKKIPEWAISHSKVPYAFKFGMIEHEYMRGYKQVYWMDSTMRLLKSPEQLLNDSKGIVAFDNVGHPLKNYINDTAIKNLNIKDLDTIKQIWGGCVFYDFSRPGVGNILSEIIHHINIGSFNDDKTTRSGFVGHRHDQAVLSAIFHKHGIDLLPYGIIAAKEHVTEKTYIQYGD